ncbi:type I toxin-antitoxin system Fst family toxin [Staphylococcus hominis]|nr:type I toxin-antitoxin system Fst family toxin [Staphylococcus hominis]MCI2870188.1 type I toxin-antitoxin system Fst family toxin [Staphylococcus hominis]MDS3894748.1 type I toxin-antitoxin system Fst family toxin [Staphylococcus hominis]
MLDDFIHIMTTATSSCVVALFAHWLPNHNDKKK